MSNSCSVGILMRMSASHYAFSFQQPRWSSISITEDKLGAKTDGIFLAAKQKSVEVIYVVLKSLRYRVQCEGSDGLS